MIHNAFLPIGLLSEKLGQLVHSNPLSMFVQQNMCVCGPALQ